MALDHKDMLERIEDGYRADRDNMDDGVSDLRFLAGDQWNSTVKAQREFEGKPVLTINRMGQFVRQVSGNLRQSYPSIMPVPVDGGTDKNLTDIYAGLIRQVEYRSKAGSAYAWGAECAISCGIGHWKITTDYRDADSFDQEILIKRIMDPFAVIWHGGATEIDRCDAEHVTETEIIPLADYKRRFPDQKDKMSTDMPLMPLTGSTLYWKQNEHVRIATHWYKEDVKKRLGITQEGRVFDITKWSHNAASMTGIIQARDVKSYKIMAQTMDGSEFLEDAQEWAGSYFPIVPCIGSEIPLDGLVIRHGVIRWAKDPQRLYNFWRSYSAELMGLAPKSPWLVTAPMIKGHEVTWKNANRTNQAYLTYNKDPDFPNGKPERNPPPIPAVAFDAEAKISEDEMKATTGVYDASLGARSNETSGVAIQQRQQQSDNGSFVYFDNFNFSIARTGQILVDLIPKIYDSARVIRILGADAQEAFVPINQTVQTIDGPKLVNDLSAGKFDVRIKTGPNYVNARTQAREELGKIIQADPQLMQVFGDLYFEQQDFAGAEKLAERMKRVIPPNIQGQQDPQAEQTQNQQMQVALAEAQAKIRKLEAEASLKEQQSVGEKIDNAERMGQIDHFGIAPPDHVQKAIDRNHQLDVSAQDRFHTQQGTREERDFNQQTSREQREFDAAENERAFSRSQSERASADTSAE